MLSNNKTAIRTRSVILISKLYGLKISRLNIRYSKLRIDRGGHPGADLRIFSRGGGGGGGFSKKISKILSTFYYRSTELICRTLPKHCFAPILAKFSAPQANF